MAIDAKGTPVFPGTIFAYPTHKGSSSAKLNFALVERVEEKDGKFSLFVTRLEGGKKTKVQNALTGVVIHAFHYTDEMREAVLDWEERNAEHILTEPSKGVPATGVAESASTFIYNGPPIAVKMDRITAEEIAVNGTNLPNKITVGHIDLGNLTREDADHVVEEKMREHSDWQLDPNAGSGEFNEGILIRGEIGDPEARAVGALCPYTAAGLAAEDEEVQPHTVIDAPVE